jgi:hypothetical protein
MTQARRRLGPGPLRELFFLLRGPSPADVRWRGLLVCAVDGTVMTVADSAANLAVYSKQRGGATGGSSYPQLRLLALVACGTRTVIDAVFRPCSSGETTCAAALLGSLHAGMLLLADRNFGSGKLARQVAAAEADFLVRVRTGNSSPALPAVRRLPDGSWLSRFGGVPVRVIDAAWTVTTSTGRITSGCRLVTTLTDPARYPAADLAVLYHERWEVETAYLELKSTILGGRVLRARTPDGIEQELYALLVTYQALRHRRRRLHRPGNRPRPGQLHHRPGHCPRPGHPGRGRHRRHPRRPRRPDRPARPGQAPAAQAAPDQPPRRQARHLQVQRPRQDRPQDLPGHHRHRHPQPRLANRRQALTDRPLRLVLAWMHLRGPSGVPMVALYFRATFDMDERASLAA